MDRRSFLSAVLAAGVALPLREIGWGSPLVLMSQSGNAEQSDKIRLAADHFLEGLTPNNRGQIVHPFPTNTTPEGIGFDHFGGSGGGKPGGQGGPGKQSGPDNRGGSGGQGRPPGGPGFAGEKFGEAVWTNFPVSIVKRPGVRMGDLSASEQADLHALLKVVLSPMGYQKVLDIMDADEQVAKAGPDYAAGLSTYTVALFGKPVATSPWMLQFGGHHLGLNALFVGHSAVLAPLHTGILPAKFTHSGKVVRGLGRENDKAFDLLATFTDSQLKAATIEHDISDLICGPGRPTTTQAPQGLKGSDMTDSQRAAMLEIAREWVGILNDAHSRARIEELRVTMPETYFAWTGPTVHTPGENGSSYFRLHGPKILIEYAPQSNQGGYKLHVHTVMRDIENDYAKLFLAS